MFCKKSAVGYLPLQKPETRPRMGLWHQRVIRHILEAIIYKACGSASKNYHAQVQQRSLQELFKKTALARAVLRGFMSCGICPETLKNLTVFCPSGGTKFYILC